MTLSICLFLFKRSLIFQAGTLLLSGTILFSGTLYYHAFTTDRRLAQLTPIGGTILILGWLSMVI